MSELTAIEIKFPLKLLFNSVIMSFVIIQKLFRKITQGNNELFLFSEHGYLQSAHKSWRMVIVERNVW